MAGSDIGALGGDDGPKFAKWARRRPHIVMPMATDATSMAGLAGAVIGNHGRWL